MRVGEGGGGFIQVSMLRGLRFVDAHSAVLRGPVFEKRVTSDPRTPIAQDRGDYNIWKYRFGGAPPPRRPLISYLRRGSGF